MEAKIKIADNAELRTKIEKISGSLNMVELSEWAARCARHVLHFAETELPAINAISEGFETLESWQKGEASVYQIRQSGFKIHAAARQCKTEVAKAAIRCAGQAVSTGHMREHAMICSDYAIKTIQLAFSGSVNKITDEREWQLSEIKRIIP